MRRAITLLGARGTVALVLIILIGGVVGIAKAIGGGRSPSGVGVQPGEVVATQPTVDTTTGDDGLADTELTAPTTDPAIMAAARQFVTAWLRRDLSADAWHAGLARHATTELLDLLDGVDPKGVPANRTTGEPRLAIHTDGYAEVAIPVDSGTVKLELVEDGKRWVVSGVDWERA